MSRLLLFLVIAVSLLAAQQPPRTITLTEKSNIPAAAILPSLKKSCPNVAITNDAASGDYTLEAVETSELYHGTDYGRPHLTLFDRDGKAVYSTVTRKISNAVKDVCRAINGVAKKSEKR